MIGYVFSSSISDFFKAKRWVGWMALLVVLTLLTFTWSVMSKVPVSTESFARASEFFVFRLVAFTSALFATSVIASEIEQRTIVYLVTRPVPRWQLLLGRSLAAGFLASAYMVLVLAAVSLATSRTIDPSVFFRAAGAVGLGALAYLVLYIGFSLLFNRALLWSLLYAFGWESLITNMPGQVYYLSIHNHMSSFAALPKPETVPDQSLPMLGSVDIPPMVGLFTMLGIILLLMIFNMFWFSVNEYVPREDAE